MQRNARRLEEKKASEKKKKSKKGSAGSAKLSCGWLSIRVRNLAFADGSVLVMRAVRQCWRWLWFARCVARYASHF